MSNPCDHKWSGSPFLLHRDAPVVPPMPLPAGGVLPLLQQVYPGVSLRAVDEGVTQRLLLLTHQRHLLTLAQDCVLVQRRALNFTSNVHEMLGQRRAGVSELGDVCEQLQGITHLGISLWKTFRGDRWLYPTSPSLRATVRDMQRLLAFMLLKAAMVTEELILSVLRRVSRFPDQVSGDLGSCLTMYNHILANLAGWAVPWAECQPFSLSRTLEVIAEERGRWLARLFDQTLLRGGVRESHPITSQCQATETRVREKMAALVLQDKGQMRPLLQTLSSTPSSLYDQYCHHLWPVFCSHIYQALFPGQWRQRALPVCAKEACVAAVQTLCEVLLSDGLPGMSQALCTGLCDRLLCAGAFVAWDGAFCQALGSAVTDKCLAPDMKAPRGHSRTAGLLLDVCRQLSGIPRRVCSGPLLCAVSSQRGLLSRCMASLQLCHLWLRSRTQTYVSSASLPQLVLIAYGDLRVVKEGYRALVSTAESEGSLALSGHLQEKVQKTQEAMEVLFVSMSRVLGSVCAVRSQEVLRSAMPSGRFWRGRLVPGLELVPGEYAQAAVGVVVVPVLEAALALPLEDQVSALGEALSALLESWLGHILHLRLKFSLQGALQLRCDFESVRELLRSRESGISLELLQAALSLPVFLQVDNAIVCLLQQPSHKTPLQSRSCSILCCLPLCRVAVDSVSDSLQSLNSVERRVWAWNYPTHVPRHNHESYLPHNQRQWLSLRLHKNYSGLNLPWQGREPSDG